MAAWPTPWARTCGVAGGSRRAGGAWLDRTAIHEGLGCRVVGDDLTAALANLAGEGLAESRTQHTGGRPREEWHVPHPKIRRYEESPT